MDSQSAIALNGGVEMAVSVPRHCHGPTVVAGAEDDDGDRVQSCRREDTSLAWRILKMSLCPL